MGRGRPAKLPPGIRQREGRASFEVRVWVKNPDTGAWKRVERSYKTISEAKKAQAQMRVDPPHVNARMHLDKWYEQAWPAIRASVRGSTAASYETGWRLRVCPSLGHLSLEDVTPTKIAAAYASWSGAPSTKDDALSLLARLLQAAADDGIIRYTPVRRRKLRPSDTAGSLRSHAMSSEQAAKLLAAVANVNEHYLPLTETLLTLGLRFGEAVALRVGDIAPDFAVVTVRTTTGRYGETTPKSHKERRVPVPESLRDVLRAAVKDKEPGDRVFTAPRGGQIELHNYRRDVKWDTKVRAAVGRPDLRPHDLRHTAAVAMCDAGVPVPVVQRILGHSSLTTTQRYVAPGEDAVMAALDRYTGVCVWGTFGGHLGANDNQKGGSAQLNGSDKAR